VQGAPQSPLPLGRPACLLGATTFFPSCPGGAPASTAVGERPSHHLGSQKGRHHLLILWRGHPSLHHHWGCPARLLGSQKGHHCLLILSRGAPASTAVGGALPASWGAARATIVSLSHAGGALPTSWAATRAAIVSSSHPGGTPALTTVGGALPISGQPQGPPSSLSCEGGAPVSIAVGGALPASWAATRAAIVSLSCRGGCPSFHHHWGHPGREQPLELLLHLLRSRNLLASPFHLSLHFQAGIISPVAAGAGG
jgi:hypothetical protein